MLIVNIEKYSDFDMPVTVCTMVSDVYRSLKQTGLDSNMFSNDRDVGNAVKKLKELGFVKVKADIVRIGGNL